jgi:hypothetical protein
MMAMNTGKFLSRSSVTGLVLLLMGCSPSESEYLSGNLYGINHTSAGINYFSVNGYGGGRIPAYGWGGGTCCTLLPRKWFSGLKAYVTWETDPDPYADSPPLGTNEFREFMKMHRLGYQQHNAEIDIPQYETSDLCSLKVHFLPCNKIKITTVCPVYGQPSYPIKEPRVMQEPATCQI